MGEDTDIEFILVNMLTLASPILRMTRNPCWRREPPSDAAHLYTKPAPNPRATQWKWIETRWQTWESCPKHSRVTVRVDSYSTLYKWLTYKASFRAFRNFCMFADSFVVLFLFSTLPYD